MLGHFLHVSYSEVGFSGFVRTDKGRDGGLEGRIRQRNERKQATQTPWGCHEVACVCVCVIVTNTDR